MKPVVVHIITGLDQGGAEEMLYKVISNDAGSVFSTYVISLSTLGTVGIRVKAMGIPVSVFTLSFSINGIKNFLRLVSWLKETKPSIVQTWMYHADFAGGIAAKLAKCPNVVWNIRHNDAGKAKNKVVTRMLVRINGFLSWLVPSLIIANSNKAIQSHGRLLYRKQLFKLIPNGFDQQIFKFQKDDRQRLRQELKIANTTPLVGLVARFDKQKNHEGFCKAASIVLQKHTNARFLLAGSNVDENNIDLMSFLHRYGLRNKCFLLGERNDIPTLFSALDVAVCSSWDESFPNVIGEAMCCERLCAATDVGDCALIVGDTGLISPPGDCVALAHNIAVLLSLGVRERRLKGKLARRRVSENYSIEKIAQTYADVYTHLIQQSQIKAKY